MIFIYLIKIANISPKQLMSVGKKHISIGVTIQPHQQCILSQTPPNCGTSFLELELMNFPNLCQTDNLFLTDECHILCSTWTGCGKLLPLSSSFVVLKPYKGLLIIILKELCWFSWINILPWNTMVPWKWKPSIGLPNLFSTTPKFSFSIVI